MKTPWTIQPFVEGSSDASICDADGNYLLALVEIDFAEFVVTAVNEQHERRLAMTGPPPTNPDRDDARLMAECLRCVFDMLPTVGGARHGEFAARLDRMIAGNETDPKVQA